MKYKFISSNGVNFLVVVLNDILNTQLITILTIFFFSKKSNFFYDKYTTKE